MLCRGARRQAVGFGVKDGRFAGKRQSCASKNRSAKRGDWPRNEGVDTKMRAIRGKICNKIHNLRTILTIFY